jgi:hypothetical protein
MTVTHIAGPNITIHDRYQRQRCAWCGEILQDYDLRNVAVPAEQPGPPASWSEGALVTVDGNLSFVVDSNDLPDDACANSPADPLADLRAQLAELSATGQAANNA